MKSSPKPLTDPIGSINEELLNPLIVFIEDTNTPSPRVNKYVKGVFKRHLKDTFKVGIDKKNYHLT